MNRIEIVLKPYMREDCVERMDVRLRLEGILRAAGEELCRMQLSTVTIPGCDPIDFQVTDELGEVPVKVTFSNPYPYEQKHWHVERPVAGNVEICYTVKPRELSPEDICGPYFDFRGERRGANSAGISFLPAVDGADGQVSLHWELGGLSEGCRGVCTWGEGDVKREGGLEQFRQCYYAAGRLHSISEGEFGFYWLEEPPFSIEEIADYTRVLFGKMQEFFRDREPVYRIFMRKDPFLTSGGTALMRSYMFGWNDTQTFSVKEKCFLLAHEMVHNWPQLNDMPYGTATWYSEGTAEYYSLMLPLRLGLITPAEAMAELQKRTDAYYTNPTRGLGDMEAVKICWQDRRAQRLPYGRGLFFLANADVRIREASGGTRSIDDVVLAILEKDRAGETLGNDVFLETVRAVSGADLSAELERMRSGAPFAPLADSFGGYFTVEETETVEADTGKPAVSYRWGLKEAAVRCPGN